MTEEVARAQRAPFKPFRGENVQVSAKVGLFRVDVVTFTRRYRHDNVVFLHTRLAVFLTLAVFWCGPFIFIGEVHIWCWKYRFGAGMWRVWRLWR